MKDKNNFTYTIKVCKNNKGIREFYICKKCNIANNTNRTRCIICNKKLL